MKFVERCNSKQSMHSARTVDLTAHGSLLAFAVLNAALFMVLSGFFAGATESRKAVEPCLQVIGDQAEKCAAQNRDRQIEHHRGFISMTGQVTTTKDCSAQGLAQFVKTATEKCMEEVTKFTLFGGSMYKMLLPGIICTFLNVVIFGTIWFMRAILNTRISEAGASLIKAVDDTYTPPVVADDMQAMPHLGPAKTYGNAAEEHSDFFAVNVRDSKVGAVVSFEMDSNCIQKATGC
jgi:hypothetical protein